MEAPTELQLQGSYYDTRRFAVSLVLNNKGPDPLPVALTVHSLQGERLDLPPLELPGQSAETLSLNELLQEAGAGFQEGSLDLRYHYEGCALVLSAGLILEDAAAGVAFDELLVRPHHRVSRRLEGLWWVPSASSKLELVLSNQSDRPLTATVSGRSLGRASETKSIEVDLGPRRTRVLNLPRVWTLADRLGREQWAAGSLTVTHDGEPGDLVARGMIEDRSIRYSAVVEFSDPEAGVGHELHGTGWRLGEFAGSVQVPVLVVRNTSEEAAHVTVRIPYTEPDGVTGRLELEPTVLEPGEIRELSADVYALIETLAPAQVATAGLEIVSDTAPGTVLASAQSVSLDGDHVFRLPLVDPLTKGSAGNYPWWIGENESTVVYLKNVTAEPRQYTVQIDFRGGAYVVGMDTLDPGQTAAIDVRDLRDSQRPDVHGTVIPEEATVGEVHWSAQGRGAQNSMVGRAEYADAARGVSTTFACSSCCPDSVYQTWLDPLTMTLQVEGWGNFYPYQQNTNCYGTLLNPFLVPGIAWSSSTPSVLGSMRGGSFTGFLPGSANAEGGWEVCHHYLINYPIMMCEESCHQTFPYAPTNVKPNVIIMVPDGTNIPLDNSGNPGVTRSIDLIAQVIPSGGTFQWTTNSSKVNLANSTSSTLTVNSVGASTSQNDVTVTVTYTVNGQSKTASKQLTVVKPSSLERLQDTFNPTGHACQDLDCASYDRHLLYNIKDQFGQYFNNHLGFTVLLSESYGTVSSTCGAGSPYTGSATGAFSQIGDHFWFCSLACSQYNPQGQGCTTSST